MSAAKKVEVEESNVIEGNWVFDADTRRQIANNCRAHGISAVQEAYAKQYGMNPSVVKAAVNYYKKRGIKL